MDQDVEISEIELDNFQIKQEEDPLKTDHFQPQNVHIATKAKVIHFPQLQKEKTENGKVKEVKKSFNEMLKSLFRCQFCTRTFTTERGKNGHEKTHKNTLEEAPRIVVNTENVDKDCAFKCQFCNWKFAYKTAQLMHELRCKEALETGQNKNVAVKKVVSNNRIVVDISQRLNDGVKNKCKFCQRILSKNTSLSNHEAFCVKNPVIMKLTKQQKNEQEETNTQEFEENGEEIPEKRLKMIHVLNSGSGKGLKVSEIKIRQENDQNRPEKDVIQIKEETQEIAEKLPERIKEEPKEIYQISHENAEKWPKAIQVKQENLVEMDEIATENNQLKVINVKQENVIETDENTENNQETLKVINVEQENVIIKTENVLDNEKETSSEDENAIELEKPLECEMCWNRFRNMSDLIVHEEIHQNEKSPYKCKSCGNKFTNKSSRNLHQRKHSGQKKFHCEKCDKSFFQRHQLRAHQWVHSGQNSHKCSFCKETLISNAALKFHIETYHSEKDFVCEFCSQTFQKKSDLEFHVKSHRGKCPYECQFCDKTFANSQERSRHEYIHKSEKNHVCQTCGKAFHLKSTLKNHEKIHVASDESETSSDDSDVSEIRYVTDEEMIQIKEETKEIDEISTEILQENVVEMNTEIKLENIEDFPIEKVEHQIEIPEIVQKSMPVESRKIEPIKNTLNEKSLEVKQEKMPQVEELKSDPLEIKDNSRIKQEKIDFMEEFPEIEPIEKVKHPIEIAEIVQNSPRESVKKSKSIQKSKIVIRPGKNVLEEFPEIEPIEENIKPFKCAFCPREFKEKRRWKIHQFGHKDDSYKCQFCDRKFPFKNRRTEHEIKEHPEEIRLKCKDEIVKCQFCSITFSSLGKKNRHVSSYHSDNSIKIVVNPVRQNPAKIVVQMFECEICQKTFPDRENLEAHEKDCVIREPFEKKKCPFCSFYCLSLRFLKHHIQSKHSENNSSTSEKHKINEIKPENNVIEEFPEIEPIEENIKPFKCAFCPREFKEKRIWKIHQFGHKDDSYKCQFCDRKFPFKNRRTEHENNEHPEEIRLKCKDEIIKCQFCSKTFSSLGKKNRHVSSYHSEDLQFQCLFCDKKCARKIGLKAHMRRFHGKVQPEEIPSK